MSLHAALFMLALYHRIPPVQSRGVVFQRNRDGLRHRHMDFQRCVDRALEKNSYYSAVPAGASDAAAECVWHLFFAQCAGGV